MRLEGFLAPLVVYAVVTLLQLAIPARWVDGYVIDPRTRKPFRHRLNGRLFFYPHFYAIGLWSVADL